jgi:hypothetical protein
MVVRFNRLPRANALRSQSDDVAKTLDFHRNRPRSHVQGVIEAIDGAAERLGSLLLFPCSK